MKLKTLVLTAALAALPAVSHAGVLAQSLLFIDNLKIGTGDGAFSGGSALGANVLITNKANSGDVFSDLSGVASHVNAPVGPNLAGFSIAASQGSGYLPTTAYMASSVPVADTFAHNSSVFGGDVLNFAGLGGIGITDATTGLGSSGDASTQGNIGLTARTDFRLSGPLSLQISFNARAFQRNQVDVLTNAFGVAQNNQIVFQITLTRINPDGSKTTIFSWSPDGNPTAFAGATEYADPFSLNRTEATAFSGDNFVTNELAGGYFELESMLLATGVYQLDINQKVSADSTLIIPEPASLALMGLSLGMLGLLGRRRNKPDAS